MAVLYNGTTQYTEGSPGAFLSTTNFGFPLTIAALINTASLRTAGDWNGIFSMGEYSTSGLQFEISAAASPKLYFATTDGLSLQESYGSFTIGANTGWWLVATSWVGATRAHYGYRYSNLTLSTGTAGGGSTSDDAILAPTSEPSLIGAVYSGGSVIDFFPGAIGWVAAWADDLSSNAAATPTKIMELVTRGPWGMMDSTLLAFYQLANQNSGTIYNMNNSLSNAFLMETMAHQNSPTQTYGGPAGELPPFGIIPTMRVSGATPPAGSSGGGGTRRLFLPLRRRMV